jgi:hypothetical protein
LAAGRVRQREADGHRLVDLDRPAVQRRRLEPPALDRLARLGVEAEGQRFQDAGRRDEALLVDDRLEITTPSIRARRAASV